MTCAALLDLVDAIAAGDLEPDHEMRAHLESCPTCAAELASARRIEALLAARAAPEAPPRFTVAVQHRIRTERWNAEQRVDRIFNRRLPDRHVVRPRTQGRQVPHQDVRR